jgi:hypothetical protein
MNQSKGAADVVCGEFHTDGATFVFRLAGLPISGAGPSPQAAFDDLMAAQARAGDLQDKLRAIARDQQGEEVRATLIRMIMIWLIALTLIGGLLAGIVDVTSSAMVGGETPPTAP